jgi:flagellar biosynthetic protein FlhB
MAGGERTEQATPRRLEKARKEGQFAVSREFVAAVQFMAFVAAVASFGGDWWSGLEDIFRLAVQRAFRPEMGMAEAVLVGRDALMRAFLLFAPTLGILLLVTLAMQFATTGLGVSLKKLAPDLARLSPVSRLKDLPGQNLHAALQAALLLPVFGWAVWVVARDSAERFQALPFLAPSAAARETGAAIVELLWQGAGVFLIAGAVDLFRQRRRWRKQMRMTKHEVRQEIKESDGNPQIKGRIRRLQRDMARKCMMQEVPRATAVVVNPTHYAVALRYSMEAMAAPMVVAKGRNYLALRIRERARQHGVPIVENPPLAQALYKSADVGQEIPAHLYRAVAEILAYIYRLMHRPPNK